MLKDSPLQQTLKQNGHNEFHQASSSDGRPINRDSITLHEADLATER